MSPVRQPETTRAKILDTALELFHTRTFNGTSINEIVERSGITKGALFHHFKGKDDLGQAVINEPLREEIHRVWVEPLRNSVDPVEVLLSIMRGLAQMVRDNCDMLERGCPLNNLAQELSSHDPAFKALLQSVYAEWEDAIEAALRSGIAAGNVRPDIDPKSAAVTIVAFSEGAIGLLKVHSNLECLGHIAVGFTHFLNALRP